MNRTRRRGHWLERDGGLSRISQWTAKKARSYTLPSWYAPWPGSVTRLAPFRLLLPVVPVHS